MSSDGSSIQSPREHWTPADRNNLINDAINSESLSGAHGSYRFKIYPKLDTSITSSNDEMDMKRSLVTDIFAKTIYTKNPSYRKLSLSFYYMLVERIRINYKIGQYLWRDIMVVIKGANAYSYLTKDADLFPFSDLDVMIYINPALDDELFDEIKREMRIVLLQSISQYKRLLDNMFFTNGPNSYKESTMYKEMKLLTDDEIMEFKQDYKEEIEKLNNEPNRMLLSPFEDDDIRNDCSRFSSIYTKSIKHTECVAMIEVPHFDKAENIPLKKSPIFCSYNETINFDRGTSGLKGQFDLYRIRFNNLLVDFDENIKFIKKQKITSDFIDISIASKYDAELIDFWNTAKCEYILDPVANQWKVYKMGQWDVTTCWLVMPNIISCVNDLYKMLNVYDCPEGKKQKRLARYQALQKMIN